MRRAPILFALAALLLGVAAFPSLAHAGKAGWTLLGERRVSDKPDHDTIAVTAAGTFRQLQLRVFERPVQFHKVVVHFANGESQELELRQKVAAGDHSRAIDLAGADRVIKSIDLWYDAQSKGKSARVRVFAHH